MLSAVMVSDAGVLSCLDTKTGKENFKTRLGGNFSASPISASGRIYFFGNRRLFVSALVNLFSVDADGERCHDSQARVASSGRDQSNTDPPVDHDLFTDLACEDQHGSSSLERIPS